jgi:DNA-binding NtrC family response regulator
MLSNFLKRKKMDDSEDLNIERNEIKIITDVIIKNYNKSYPEIAKILGIPIRTFFRKLKDYDLEDLKSQVKLRGGKGWNHPYNKIDINEN